MSSVTSPSLDNAWSSAAPDSFRILSRFGFSVSVMRPEEHNASKSEIVCAPFSLLLAASKGMTYRCGFTVLSRRTLAFRITLEKLALGTSFDDFFSRRGRKLSSVEFMSIHYCSAKILSLNFPNVKIICENWLTRIDCAVLIRIDAQIQCLVSKRNHIIQYFSCS